MGTSRTVVHYALGDNRDYEFEWSKAVLEYLEKGYPAEEKKQEDRYDTERVHFL